MRKCSFYFLFFYLAILVPSCTCNKTTSSIGEGEDSKRVVKGIFDIPELNITPSPNSSQSISFESNEKAISFSVSPIAPIVAVLIEKSGKYSLKFWEINKKEFSESFDLPESSIETEVCWHPCGKTLFVVSKNEKSFQILNIQKDGSKWNSKNIYSDEHEIKNLVMCPRPFVVGDESKGKENAEFYAYRLFFGLGTRDKTFRIASITETGSRFYQVIGPTESITHYENVGEQPSEMKADWALPVAFHPSGNELIWMDKSERLYVAEYSSKCWSSEYNRIEQHQIKKGKIEPTPNGLAWLHWVNGKPGVGIYLLSTHQEKIEATGTHFLSAPSMVADGKGVVGLSQSNGKISLIYSLVQMPLADVYNAWMYAENSEQLGLLSKHSGLFRTLESDQLYELYD